MPTAFNRHGTGAIPGIAMLLGACVAPPPQPPIEVNVTVRDAGTCCLAGQLVSCHDRTADIKTAYADPEKLHHTLAELGFSDFDRPGTGEHDRGETIEHDRGGTIERDRAGTIERDRGDTIEHDLLRCEFRNKQLRSALATCHQERNRCLSNNVARAKCNDDYNECYIKAVLAGPFDEP